MRRHEFYHRHFSPLTALIAVLALSVLCLAPATAKADDDDYFRAKTIAVNQTYTASAAEARDDIWYRFELKQAGPVKICLTSVGQAWGEWEVSLYDASRRDDDDIFEYEAHTRNGSHETVSMGLAAGTYYLEIEGDDDDYRRGATYGLQVVHSADSSWETELNDGPRVADSLTLGSAVKATTLYVDDDDDDRDDFDDDDDWDDDDDDEDEDWFKLVLKGGARVKLSFSNDTRSRGGWNVQVFSERDFRSSRALYSMRHRASGSGFESEELSLGAGTYYVKVDPSVGTTGLGYTLAVREAESSGGDDAQRPQGGEMHRLYNRYTGEHFYTSDDDEFESLKRAGWTDEGRGWVAPESGDEVWRLYNPYVQGGDHHYTMDRNEYDTLATMGWRKEGLGWYSAPKGGGEPVYRQYNPYATTGTHNYTTSTHERDVLMAAGWKDEGIAWYAVSGK